MHMPAGRALADFLNHGILPFIGRDREIARIMEFWHGTYHATALRAMLLSGEAGIGKSRLLEQAAQRVVAAGGSVVHVKLYPESAASFPSLVARGLRHPHAARWLLHQEIEPRVSATGAALQRLARFRPTLLVVEDLHLLGSESVADFSRLIRLLAEESLSLLAMTRPIQQETRSLLEPYLTEDIVLEGLGREECADVWSQVYGAETGDELATALHEATVGNPLALRSALRGALQTAESQRAGVGGPRRPAEQSAHIVRRLRQSVGLLAGGLIAHLSRAELDAAQRLATLGEVFAREAAGYIIDDAESSIEALLFKGVVATAVAPPEPLAGVSPADSPAAAPEPLAGASSVLGFTHTLLHRHLMESASVDAERLISAVARAPLHSTVPFRILASQPWAAAGLDIETIERAYDRAFKVHVAGNHGAPGPAAEYTWRTAARLVASRLGAWQPEQWHRMVVRLLNHRLNLVRYQPAAERETWLARLMDFAGQADTDELIKGRLVGLFHRELLQSPHDASITAVLWEQAEALVATRPHLRATFVYTDYVVAACVGASGNNDTVMMRRIEASAEALITSGALPEDVLRVFQRKVRPPLLTLYDSPDELQTRLARIDELERTVEKGQLGVWKSCLDVLAATASVDRFLAASHAVEPFIREQGPEVLLADLAAKGCLVVAGRGQPIDVSVEAFNRVMANEPAWRRQRIEPIIAAPFVDAALLLGDAEQARALVERFAITANDLEPATWLLLLARDADAAPGAPGAVASQGEPHEELGSLTPLYTLMTSACDAAHYGAVAEILATPVLRFTDLLGLTAAVWAVHIGHRRGVADPLPPVLAAAAADALARALAWLADPDRALFAYMPVLLERAATFLPAADIAVWRARANELASSAARQRQERGAGEDARLRLRMLGTIEAHMPDGGQRRFQGARARMLLATMVINRMLPEPLGSAEFCRIAAGGDGVEIENARDVVKTTVHRLRELIGRDAILTTGATPSLNPDRVEVDLLRAHELLGRVASTMRQGLLMQAKGALTEALAITGGDVPFPSLYDDIVEATRESFETTLRRGAIDVSAALLRQGAAADAAELLHGALHAIPGDEELAELLHGALLQAGRRTEAERIVAMLADES